MQCTQICTCIWWPHRQCIAHSIKHTLTVKYMFIECYFFATHSCKRMHLTTSVYGTTPLGLPFSRPEDRPTFADLSIVMKDIMGVMQKEMQGLSSPTAAVNVHVAAPPAVPERPSKGNPPRPPRKTMV